MAFTVAGTETQQACTHRALGGISMLLRRELGALGPCRWALGRQAGGVTGKHSLSAAGHALMPCMSGELEAHHSTQKMPCAVLSDSGLAYGKVHTVVPHLAPAVGISMLLRR